MSLAMYTGTVCHRRLGAPERTFVHRVALAYVDLDELPVRLGIVQVQQRDLLGDAAAVHDLVAQRSGRPAPDGPVRVLTSPRVLGLCFNPVSFYFCFDAAEKLDAVVAEVTSTPWLQRHAYVLLGDGPVLRGRHEKRLHVSPFQDMEHEHAWAVTVPGETLSVHVSNHRLGDGAADFDATLKLRRSPPSRGALLRGSPVRTLGLIYGHALALKLRGARHFRPPEVAR